MIPFLHHDDKDWRTIGVRGLIPLKGGLGEVTVTATNGVIFTGHWADGRYMVGHFDNLDFESLKDKGVKPKVERKAKAKNKPKKPRLKFMDMMTREELEALLA